MEVFKVPYAAMACKLCWVLHAVA